LRIEGLQRLVPKVAPQRCLVFGPGGTFGGGVNLARLDWGGFGAEGRRRLKESNVGSTFRCPRFRSR
jgi:hypothetical protein